MPLDAQSTPQGKRQFSLRRLWLIISVCGLTFTVPAIGWLTLYLFWHAGLMTAIFLVVVGIQLPGILLFKALGLLPEIRTEASGEDCGD